MEPKLFTKLVASFPALVMSRGSELLRAGRVKPAGERFGRHEFQVDDLSIRLVEVQIDPVEPRLSWTCTCTGFGRSGSCEHCWGALLFLSRAGRLDELPPFTSLGTEGGNAPARTGSDAAAWKASLARLQHSTSPAVDPLRTHAPPAAENGEQWIYVWSNVVLGEASASISVLATRPKKSGKGHTKGTPVPASAATAARAPTPADWELVRRMTGCRHADADYGGGPGSRSLSFAIDEVFDPGLLQAISDTGRLYAALEADGRGVHEGPVTLAADHPLRLRLELVAVEAGWHSVQARLLDDAGQAVPLDKVLLALPLHALDRRTKTLHPLAESPAARWFDQWSNLAPLRVSSDHVNEFLSTWLGTPGFPPLDMSAELRERLCDVEPVPRLRIRDKRLPETNWVLATLSFGYAGQWVEIGGRSAAVLTAPDGRVLVRKPESERAFATRLSALGICPALRWDRRESGEYEAMADVLPDAIPALVREGWVVESGTFKHRLAGEFALSVASGVDWFDLHGSVMFDEFKVPLPDLLAAMRNKEGWVTLADGSRGVLPKEWLGKLGGLLELGASGPGGAIRFKTSQALLLDALLAAQPRVDVDAVFAAARDRLRDFTSIGPADPPDSFKGTLRGYQCEGLGWLRFLAEYGFGGCLADDMGLGKTVQVLARLAERADLRRNRKIPADERPGPSLVVAPRSLMFNWMAEAARFCPTLRVLDWSGPDRARDPAAFADVDLVLTTYGVLRSDAALLSGVPFDYAILDESQAIKNDKTASAKAARLLKASHRLAMSGTPIENHLGELWSLFEFLNPGLLGTSGRFEKMQQAAPDADSRVLLGRALRPYILRRTKEQVAPELPARTENTLYCELEGRQRKDYDELRDFYRARLLGQSTDSELRSMTMNVLEALLRLRQTACHPGLVDPARGGDDCAKFDLLLPRLQEVIEEGHKVLVFSQFTSLLDLLKPILDKAGIVYEYLDGQTRDRQARVERFQTDTSVHVFLISLKAGGVGLNLTAADYVFLLDPWWNPAAEAQAIDRAHRIGQVRHVMAYRVIAKDTIEERVLELQASKRALADAILSADNSLLRNLKREDLEMLLT